MNTPRGFIGWYFWLRQVLVLSVTSAGVGKGRKRGSKRGSVRERGGHELHQHLLERFTKWRMEKPSEIPLFEQELAAGYELCSWACTRAQFLLLLFQRGEGAGLVPLEVLAGWTVLGLMLLCQGAPLDLAPIIGWSHWWLWGLWWWSFWVCWRCRRFGSLSFTSGCG